MQHTFLIDENLVIVGGDHEHEALRIWLAISKNCHRIGLDHRLHEKYRQKFNWAKSIERQRSVLGNALIKVIMGILRDSDKGVLVQPSGVCDVVELVRDEDDRYLAHIACEVVRRVEPAECILVTTDHATCADFNHEEMMAIGISGVAPDAGVKLASESCP